MTRLLEDDALRLLAQQGIAVPEFVVATNAQEAARATEVFGGESVLKALIPAGGRAEAGAVRIARSAEEAWGIAEGLLGEKVLGFRVDRVLVSRLIEAEWEISVLIAPDPQSGKPAAFASALGGIDVADLIQRDPASLVRCPLEGTEAERARALADLAAQLGLGAEEGSALVPTVQSMHRAFLDAGAEMLEINPLMIAGDGTIVAPTATVLVRARETSSAPAS